MRHVEIAVSGAVTVTAKLNVRQGAPALSSPVLRKQDAGSHLDVLAISAGEDVQGNPLWYRTQGDCFVWTGACSALVALAPGEAIAVPPVAHFEAPHVEGPIANVVDLYHGDEVTSFDAARVAGVLGVIHKATTGESGRDDTYRERRDAAKTAGLLWGAYHWGTAKPVAKQVDNFLTWAKPDDETLVALDFESTPGNQMTLAQAREFLERIEVKLGRKAVIYSGSTIKDALGTRIDPYFGAHRLWLAQYGPSATVQASWDRYWLWQFTEGKANDPRRKRVPGIPGNSRGELDCDFYAGAADQLQAEWAS
jgi:GH25 family lysozyme M1 (1,4-beta-N-acetylmuramidase)